MKLNEIYIVTAYRWGDRDEHSYNVGVFNSKYKAMQAADNHCYYRGGKYACAVEKCILNHLNNKDLNYTEEIYRAKSIKD